MYEGAKQRSVIVEEDGEERVDDREEEGGSYFAGGRCRDVVKKTGCGGRGERRR